MPFRSPVLCVLDSAFVKVSDHTVPQIMRRLADDAFSLTGLSADYINTVLIQREELASSAVGAGVAIPHLRLKNIPKPLMIFASLATPLDFNAPDRQPVDLVLLVISPDSDGPMHLRRLARVSRVMCDDGLRDALRAAKTPEQVHSLMLSVGDDRLAA